MISQGQFYIRDTRQCGVNIECPVCGDQCTPTEIAVFDGNNVPLCDLCAWDRAPELASLLILNAAARSHSAGGIPGDIWRALEKRKSDPERLQKELKEARDVLGRCNGSILSELVTHEIEAALKGDDVPTKQNALKAFREMDTGDEIPF